MSDQLDSRYESITTAMLRQFSAHPGSGLGLSERLNGATDHVLRLQERWHQLNATDQLLLATGVTLRERPYLRDFLADLRGLADIVHSAGLEVVQSTELPPLVHVVVVQDDDADDSFPAEARRSYADILTATLMDLPNQAFAVVFLRAYNEVYRADQPQEI